MSRIGDTAPSGRKEFEADSPPSELETERLARRAFTQGGGAPLLDELFGNVAPQQRFYEPGHELDDESERTAICDAMLRKSRGFTSSQS